MTFTSQDHQWMTKALEFAELAAQQQEVPVGAVIVYQGDLIAATHNQPIRLHDPTAHAEILAIRQAATILNNYRLPGTSLYVSLEPCAMCVGAIIHARIARVIVAANDPKTGACGGACHLLQEKFHNHRVDYQTGLLAEESASLLRQFFQDKRK